MSIARVSTTYTAVNLKSVAYGRGVPLIAIRTATYRGTTRKCKPTTLSRLLIESGTPDCSVTTRATTTTAAITSGHFRIPLILISMLTSVERVYSLLNSVYRLSAEARHVAC